MPASKKTRLLKPHITPSQYPFLLIGLAFFIGFCTHILITVIFAESKGDGIIHACVKKRSGEIRIITEYKEYREGKREKERKENKEDSNGCRDNETALEWNIQGQPGTNGNGGSSLPLVCTNCDVNEFANGRLTGKDLSNAILNGTGLNNADLSGVSFKNAVLEEASLSNANLSNANFEGANLKNAEMENTNLNGVIWNNTICPDGSNSNDHGNTCNDHLSQE